MAFGSPGAVVPFAAYWLVAVKLSCTLLIHISVQNVMVTYYMYLVSCFLEYLSGPSLMQ